MASSNSTEVDTRAHPVNDETRSAARNQSQANIPPNLFSYLTIAEQQIHELSATVRTCFHLYEQLFEQNQAAGMAYTYLTQSIHKIRQEKDQAIAERNLTENRYFSLQQELAEVHKINDELNLRSKELENRMAQYRSESHGDISSQDLLESEVQSIASNTYDDPPSKDDSVSTTRGQAGTSSNKRGKSRRTRQPRMLSLQIPQKS